jgi:putative Ca2+/H+ antiporter (TMEM165/GDT1 family)
LTGLADEEGKHDLIPWDSLTGSFASIAATEIGDKTFIVAALMAMRYPRFQVFTAAASALLIMTILSAVAGHVMGAIISKKWAAVVAALLFLFFGAKSIQEGMAMDPNAGVGEEMREVEAELEEKEIDIARAGGQRSAYSLEAGTKGRESPSPSGSPSRRSIRSPGGIKNLLSLLLSPAWVETFSMTFVGELGDRSQIATVAMAAGQEYFWVMVGACLGHLVCTSVAVLGGSLMAGRISMKKGNHALLNTRAPYANSTKSHSCGWRYLHHFRNLYCI